MNSPLKFGPYELARRLAVGATAEIFLATRRGPEQFQKRLVIKRLHEHLANESAAAAMFVDEAKLLVSLDHPGLVRALEFTEIEGHHCIVMEYLEGKSLAEIVSVAAARGVDVPPELCALILSNACRAVAYVHDHHGDHGEPLEIIHRDLSTSNIVVTRQGDVKVLDFGIAKHVGSAPTHAGVIKGSYAYMSPEQARGDTLDPRTDTFSLGVVLLELLTLRRLQADVNSPDDVARAITARGAMTQVPESVETETIPASLRGVLRRMLQPDRERRPRAITMSAELESYLAETERPFASHLARFFEEEVFSDPTVVDTTVPLAALGSGEVAVHGVLADPTRVIHPEELRTLQTPIPTLDLEPTLVVNPPAASDRATQTVRAEVPQASGVERRPRRVVFGAMVSLALVIGLVMAIWRSRTPVDSEPGAAFLTEGSITVDTDPPGLDVGIDGQISGAKSPLTVTGVEPGTYLVAVTAPDGKAQSMRVQVKRGQDAAVFFSLKTNDVATDSTSDVESARAEVHAREPQTKPRETRKRTKTKMSALRGSYVIESTPRLVVLDGKKSLGSTPLKQHNVKPGRHRLTLVSREHGVRKFVVVDVKAGVVTHEKIVLKKGKARFAVVPWAEVYIGKKKLGTTPMPPVALFEGTYLITLRNPQLGANKTVPVTVEAGDTVVVSHSMD